jgi:hypothetical protein
MGIELVDIPSGMGGTLPAAIAARHEDGTTQVICLHEEYFPNYLFTVKTELLRPISYRLSAFARKCIHERLPAVGAKP